MADFVSLDGYNVKDAAAGKTLAASLNQGEIDLKRADGTIIGNVIVSLDGSGTNGVAPADVDIDGTTLADGDVLTYVAADQKWENLPASGGGIPSSDFLFAINTNSGNIQSVTNIARTSIPITDSNCLFYAIVSEYSGPKHTICTPIGVSIDCNGDIFSWALFYILHPNGGNVTLDLYFAGLTSGGGLIKVTISGYADSDHMFTPDYGAGATYSAVQYIGQ